ncbi:MAG: hypothetical protein IKB98_05165 [Clostridia bacterium]|nr:hypothetical protein [Clostridia bacterium]
MIEIKQVKTSRDISLFVKYPLKLYKDCPYYVPSVMMDEKNNFSQRKNPNLKDCDYQGFLAYKDGELVGRIAALINWQEISIYGEKVIRFSRFECIDDLEVFKALLSAVAEYGKSRGLEYMHGPWGFNDTDREGMLTYGFNLRSTYSTNYYYPYFHKNVEALGFEPESKWVEMNFGIPKETDERSARLSEMIMKKYGVREVSDTLSVKEILERYGDAFFDTFNKAYSHLDGFVPIVDKGMQQSVLDQFAVIVNTKYISIIIDKDEKMAGFGICLPSICEPLQKHGGKLLPALISILKAIKTPRELEMALIAVRPEYKNAGINAIMIDKIMRNIIADGVERVESNPMLESNLSVQQQWKFADSEIIKRRQTYKIKIGDLLNK